MRIMAIDYGDARTGVALSDPTGFLAGQTFLIKSRKQEVVLEELAALVQRQGAQELVMGYPRNMDGTLGPRAEKYAAFARRLEEATGLPVALWDERRTTVDAHRILGEQGVRAKNRKDKIDSVAATLILEGYLDWKRLQAQRQEREEETL
ncbi:MAG: Holliday junction resolvase RuvX [Firmicutes bacterium]|nr:Holliday junction resolvase RuvX [Bacillota bacterium]